MKSFFLITIIYSFFLTGFTNSYTPESNYTKQDTTKKNGQAELKDKPFISLQNKDCIEKGKFQVFKINNLSTLNNLAVVLKGATGRIESPISKIGNGDFKIKILNKSNVDSVTIEVIDYGNINRGENNKTFTPGQQNVIISQKIKICN